MEVSPEDALNPIVQDIKKGELRNFKYGDIPFNYGCLPQTWENPNVICKRTGHKGDNDPIDVVEIGGTPAAMGAVMRVKILGALALIDEEETDWKVLAIRMDDPRASQCDTEADVEEHFPGAIAAVRDWFRMYKTADGKPENSFAFDGKFQDRSYALDVVKECNEEYAELRRAGSDKLWLPTKK
jgi:inorganic pyrophosphatase